MKPYTRNSKKYLIPTIAPFVKLGTIEKMQTRDCLNSQCGRDGDGCKNPIPSCDTCLYSHANSTAYIDWIKTVNKK